ncbi:MAG: tRNA pseudouridine synthase A [Cyclobacteriaceae bacterium]
MTYPGNYLVEIQYLGFRYHGWAIQPDVKTVQYMIERTLNYVLDGQPFKVLGTSRTDAMVSALHSGFQLFLKEELRDLQSFLNAFNENLPADIGAVAIREVPPDFNIIQSPKAKEYRYSFYIASEKNPMYAAYLTHLPAETDVALMAEGCKFYMGRHDFRNYTVKAREACFREIDFAAVMPNEMYTGPFFPDQNYMLSVRSPGFMRQQVRLMMGQLILLGRGELSMDDFRRSLEGDPSVPATYVAPASGLLLYRIDFGL